MFVLAHERILHPRSTLANIPYPYPHPHRSTSAERKGQSFSSTRISAHHPSAVVVVDCKLDLKGAVLEFGNRFMYAG
ncbi:hypothetical protein GALMADRAFT_936122 [Galerina marginata CBS 339.88]|uniref:Uncharacterized protein n=1 Tax=Galerina marginata (strain CBS 339.88) TaxID=685588 RepID=A0A067SFT8_GALM3|nr:hypothetical protein GALMADRAFT_936122 [Galerina marginata CBS 339.88]